MSRDDGVIRVRDLVVTVRGHQCDRDRIFQVEEIRQPDMGLYCRSCMKFDRTDELVAVNSEGEIFCLSWPRKIQPLSELESESAATEREVEHHE